MQNYQGIENSAPATTSFSGGLRGEDEMGRIGVPPAIGQQRTNDSSRAVNSSANNGSSGSTTTWWKRNKEDQQQQQQRRKLEKRDSIGSYDGNSSLNSFTIDELVGNLEGLELDVDVNHHNTSITTSHNNNNDGSINNSNSNFLLMNDSSTTSRFSAGNWSIRDLEKWTCSTCTFENEPVFCVCEMCGQAKPTVAAAATAIVGETAAAALPSTSSILDSSRNNLDSDSIRVQQEQRLSELLQFRQVKPAATTTTTTTTTTTAATAPSEATVSKSSSGTQLPPLAVASSTTTTTASVRPISPKPPRAPTATNTRPLTTTASTTTWTRTGKELLIPDIQKPRRSFNPEDSAATATTFDMSGSTGAFDWSFPSLQYPGIDEQQEGQEEQQECHNNNNNNNNNRATTTAER